MSALKTGPVGVWNTADETGAFFWGLGVAAAGRGSWKTTGGMGTCCWSLRGVKAGWAGLEAAEARARLGLECFLECFLLAGFLWEAGEEEACLLDE